MNRARDSANALLTEWGEYERRKAELSGYPSASSIAWAFIGGSLNPPGPRVPRLPGDMGRPPRREIRAVGEIIRAMLSDEDNAVRQAMTVVVVHYSTSLKGVEARLAANVGSQSQYDHMLGWGKTLVWRELRRG